MIIGRRSYRGTIHTQMRAARLVRARKPLADARSRSGNRRVSGLGGHALGLNSRQIAAPKQKALNSIRTEPVAPTSKAGTTLVRSALAPTPDASAANPVRTQAAKVRSAASSVRRPALSVCCYAFCPSRSAPSASLAALLRFCGQGVQLTVSELRPGPTGELRRHGRPKRHLQSQPRPLSAWKWRLSRRR